MNILDTDKLEVTCQANMNTTRMLLIEISGNNIVSMNLTNHIYKNTNRDSYKKLVYMPIL